MLAERLRAEPHLGGYIESILFDDERDLQRHAEGDSQQQGALFIPSVIDILQRCQPRELTLGTDEMVHAIWNDALRVDRLERLELKVGDWFDDVASVWMPLINRASTTLKDLSINFMNDLNENDVNLPRPGSHSFPMLERLELTHFSYCQEDAIDPSTVVWSRRLLPLVQGILRCSSPDRFRELVVDKTISHELVCEALRVRGQHLKRLGTLICAHLPGMDSIVEAQSQAAENAQSFAEAEDMMTVPQPPAVMPTYERTLAALAPNLEYLSVRRIPLAVLSTLPSSLEHLRIWLPFPDEQSTMADLLDEGTLLPHLKRLEVEMRSLTARKVYQPLSDEQLGARAWIALKAVCEKRRIELIVAKPLYMWYD